MPLKRLFQIEKKKRERNIAVFVLDSTFLDAL